MSVELKTSVKLAVVGFLSFASVGVLQAAAGDFPSKESMWSLADAGREKTACRDKISLNGLWAFKV
ncbi:MAG: hypothetical protein IKO55_17660, partial [Kiritimatiellae bacterium]|nr:hypothetical protein [Kiritimatiellia bacterium]